MKASMVVSTRLATDNRVSPATLLRTSSFIAARSRSTTASRMSSLSAKYW
jgi:hypothetical protein